MLFRIKEMDNHENDVSVAVSGTSAEQPDETFDDSQPVGTLIGARSALSTPSTATIQVVAVPVSNNK